jgi:hypothetical protein
MRSVPLSCQRGITGTPGTCPSSGRTQSAPPSRSAEQLPADHLSFPQLTVAALLHGCCQAYRPRGQAQPTLALSIKSIT